MLKQQQKSSEISELLILSLDNLRSLSDVYAVGGFLGVIGALCKIGDFGQFKIFPIDFLHSKVIFRRRKPTLSPFLPVRRVFPLCRTHGRPIAFRAISTVSRIVSLQPRLIQTRCIASMPATMYALRYSCSMGLSNQAGIVSGNRTENFSCAREESPFLYSTINQSAFFLNVGKMMIQVFRYRQGRNFPLVIPAHQIKPEINHILPQSKISIKGFSPHSRLSANFAHCNLPKGLALH